ncbi:MAG: U32 family peptidase [Candidatus Lokiarchaeota archaeon]|nr:U32 family peptidase [Candidatus Lokiarchaeota archaeon]
MNRPELLVPIQNWKTLNYIENLPDAIYFGIDKYNMRLKAKNFKRSDIYNITEYCHVQEPKIKAYLCTNIIIYNSELDDLEKLIGEAKDANIDAIIAHDIAAISLAKKYNIPFHVSTQANISNIQSALFYENLGAKRIVLARELSLIQIKEIKSQLSTTEIECFIHGSMCTAISGRCYLSATICESEEYSANRGLCIQPCRREWKMIDDENHEIIYNGELFLNAKDLCMVEYIPALITSGIDAFKIEGRMKDPLYVKTITQCYKEAITSYFNGTYDRNKINYLLQKLSRVYNRGFHTGFYFNKPTIEDIQLKNRGNISPFKKHYIGKVVNCDKENKIFHVLLENMNISLNVGDELIIIGDHTFSTEIIKKMKVNDIEIETIKRENKEDSPKIEIIFKNSVNIDDRVYILSNL